VLRFRGFRSHHWRSLHATAKLNSNRLYRATIALQAILIVYGQRLIEFAFRFEFLALSSLKRRIPATANAVLFGIFFEPWVLFTPSGVHSTPRLNSNHHYRATIALQAMFIVYGQWLIEFAFTFELLAFSSAEGGMAPAARRLSCATPFQSTIKN